MTKDDVLTIVEIARKWRVSKMTVYRLVRVGELPSRRIGRSIRITREDYETYLELAKRWHEFDADDVDLDEEDLDTESSKVP